MEHQEVHLIRTVDTKYNQRIWVVCTQQRTVWGKPGESKTAVLKRFSDKVGFTVKKISTYGKCMRASEAAMTMADIKFPNPRKDYEKIDQAMDFRSELKMQKKQQ